MKKIVIRPIITEKTLEKADKLNQYTFMVNSTASKIEIAQRIAKKFDVKVEKVRVLNMLGKYVRFGKSRIQGRRSDFKKAVVTLNKGNSIPIFEIK